MNASNPQQFQQTPFTPPTPVRVLSVHGAAGARHNLRHRLATHLIKRGQDIWTVKELLGHKDGDEDTIGG